ncbi:MAG: threonine synthase [Methanomassiliicoccales archaeon]|nr:threonine synthase [Methanomassiliicoccales archaeon]
MSFEVRCWECGKVVDDPYSDSCPDCGGLLDLGNDRSELKGLTPYELRRRPIGVWRYAPFLPVREEKAVTLKEGGTPLYDCRSLGGIVGLKRVWVKYEGANPTGSFKDRGMTVGVTRALELGAKVVGCASTGNTSASLAAYAAKAGLDCAVVLPAGNVAAGKLAQAVFFGAKVIAIDGNFDDALRIVRELAAKRYLYLLNSINPFRPEGQKTVGFEIIDQLDFQVPDRIVLPVGNAGNIWSVYKALIELADIGWIDRMPKLVGVQASGSKPIVDAFKAGKSDFTPVCKPETVATAIRIGNPVSGKKALKAIYDTGGSAVDVSDGEILDAQKILGRAEGIGVEPASAASVAGMIKLVQTGSIGRDERVVCICTGNVLKDPDIVLKSFGKIRPVPADFESVKKIVAPYD